jgi:hypothetical protein
MVTWIQMTVREVVRSVCGWVRSVVAPSKGSVAWSARRGREESPQMDLDPDDHKEIGEEIPQMDLDPRCICGWVAAFVAG